MVWSIIRKYKGGSPVNSGDHGLVGAPPLDECILHIGLEKTGSSTIQHFLSGNRALLAREGVHYPSVTGLNGGSQWGFVICAHDRPWTIDVSVALGLQGEEACRTYADQFLERFDREIRAAGKARTLMISSEHFHSRLRTAGSIARLRDILQPLVQDLRVVMYLRRQDLVAVSLYSTKIKSGNTKPQLFPGLNDDSHIPYYFDFNTVYEMWVEVFGEDAVDVRLFEPGNWQDGNILYDFCDAVGIDIEGKKLPSTINQSLSAVGSDFLLEVNRQMPNIVDGRRNRERDQLTVDIAAVARGRSYPASREQAQRFYQKFKEGNERLRQRLFPERSGPLFDEDFSCYPEQYDGDRRSYEDAVRLAVQLWRRLKEQS